MKIELPDWVLFQEYYDRKSGDHHGTKATFLKKQTYTIKSSQFEEGARENDILFPYPEKVYSEYSKSKEWAKLTYSKGRWVLTNLDPFSVIPVYGQNSEEDYIEGSLLRLGSDRYHIALHNCDTFIIHSTETKIVQLPGLAAYRQYGNEKEFLGLLRNNRIKINIDGYICHPGEPSYLEIENYFIEVKTRATYRSMILPQNDLQTGYWPLFPGDLITFDGQDFTLLIDVYHGSSEDRK